MLLPAVSIRTLATHPRLVVYVRRFYIQWETVVVESPSPLLRIAHDIVRTLIPMLVHLDLLELSFARRSRILGP
jgi:hypothetical protein